MNLSLTIFSSYYRNEGRVGIKFTKEAKRFLCKLIGEENVIQHKFYYLLFDLQVSMLPRCIN